MSRGPATTETELEHLTALFKLLSDKTRLHILILLAAGEQNVTMLCEKLGLPQPTVSHHLGLLRLGHVITNRRDGKQVFYGLSEDVEIDDRKTVRLTVEGYEVVIASREA